MRRAIRILKRSSAWAVDRALEPMVPSGHGLLHQDAPAVFIVGGPRSGSTLVYHALVHSFRFTYLSNLLAMFPRSAPVVAGFLRTNMWRPSNRFVSDYGTTKGLANPSEAGRFWDLVFPWQEHHEIEPSMWAEDRIAFVRQRVGSLVKIYSAPFLCKNVWHSVRIEALHYAFPRSVFIVMRRDPLVMAQSVLARRRMLLGDGAGFWSVRPRKILEKRNASGLEHVAWQLAYTYQAIEAARQKVGESLFMDIPYEAFCRAPEQWVHKVDVFLRRHGIEAERSASISNSFNPSTKLLLQKEQIIEFQDIIRESEAEGIALFSDHSEY